MQYSILRTSELRKAPALPTKTYGVYALSWEGVWVVRIKFADITVKEAKDPKCPRQARRRAHILRRYLEKCQIEHDYQPPAEWADDANPKFKVVYDPKYSPKRHGPPPTGSPTSRIYILSVSGGSKIRMKISNAQWAIATDPADPRCVSIRSNIMDRYRARCRRKYGSVPQGAFWSDEPGSPFNIERARSAGK